MNGWKPKTKWCLFCYSIACQCAKSCPVLQHTLVLGTQTFYVSGTILLLPNIYSTRAPYRMCILILSQKSSSQQCHRRLLLGKTVCLTVWKEDKQKEIWCWWASSWCTAADDHEECLGNKTCWYQKLSLCHGNIPQSMQQWSRGVPCCFKVG